MRSLLRAMTLGLVGWGLMLAAAPAARAQVVFHPQVVTPSVTYSYYPTTVQPHVAAYQPATSFYSAPAVSFYQPPVTYYQPTVAHYQPTVSFYQPAVSYYAPAVAAPAGTVTTRSFVGLGIFRPRGVYTQSYYTPGVVAPRTSLYAPILWR